MLPLIARWEPVMGVTVERFFVQRMKTEWESCTCGTHSIRLNITTEGGQSCGPAVS